ncbi:trypsin-like serine protease [Conidiobolus coronatus NRRL 28638]|uniref:Trypsin-like serine protease n=1 Tax=Conidiobolus coronatus (strain ATCC 28846 / CBS 209.66 / NRRL 28638) TaxID=796925 RepID=A0A137P0P5_CONC2|nr:trypsin-like serine protease [Conidiobolus coronatus NRRL 28638]|eukprot:KXN68587.1 trypsin-like serine protease [Conidiobolus coronatus NRRL 28638]
MYDIHPPCKLSTKDLATMWIDSKGQQCSGAYLGNNIVITAGHCVVANNKFTIDTLQYEPALEPDVQSFRPIEVMSFVSKNKPYNNYRIDVALIKLSGNLKNKSVWKIGTSAVQEFKDYDAYAYGTNQDDCGTYMCRQAKAFYNKALSDKNPITRFRTHAMLFGDNNKRDYTNVGDSGSILADGTNIVGILSGGEEGLSKYTDVTPFANFINQVVSGNVPAYLDYETPDGIEKIHPKWYNYNNTSANQNPNFEDTCNYAAIQSSIAQEFIR